MTYGSQNCDNDVKISRHAHLLPSYPGTIMRIQFRAVYHNNNIFFVEM